MDPQQDGTTDSPGRAPELTGRSAEVQNKADFPVSVLLIPAPDQTETPVRMTIDGFRLSTTIGEVRHRAQTMISSQPEIGRLRLIHSGRLLSRDDQTLEQLVGFEAAQANNIIAIHLILRPLPGASRSHSLTRSGSPANAVLNPGQPNVIHGFTAAQPQVNPLLQPTPVQSFPPRPSSTPAMPHTQGPYAAPLQQQAPPGFASHGMPNPQQAQFMQQLQQQHLNMMQAMLRQTPMQPGHPLAPGQQGHQMTLPDFQRIYNQQAQARQAQQASLSGRTTPQGFSQLPRGNVMQTAAGPGSSQHQADNQSGTDSLHPQNVPNIQRLGQQNVNIPVTANLPRMTMPNQNLQSPWAPGGVATQSTTTNAAYASEYDSVFLLSSPLGHEAILVGPRPTHDHVAYQQRLSSTGPSTVLGAAAAAAAQQGNVPALAPVEAAAVPAGHGQPVQARDVLALMMPLGGQLWLIIRLAGIVALLTLNASWSRTLIIWTVAFIIYLAQTEALNPLQRAAEQAWLPVRRHIEDLVRDVEDQQGASAGTGDDPARAAERLMRRQRDQSVLRRIERSVALFLASFVPGVGEAQVAAREAAERRREREERERQEQAERAVQQEASASNASESQALEAQSRNAAGGDRDGNASGRDEGGPESTVRQRQPRVEDANDELA